MKVRILRYLKHVLFTVFSLSLMAFLITGCSLDDPANQQSSNSSAQASEENVPQQINIGYFQSPNAELLAKGEQLLQKKYPNVKINYVQFDVGRDVNAAIASGSIDIGTIGTPPGTIGIVNKLPYKIYYLHDIIGSSEALVVKNSANIKSINDLVGKKIATPFGSTSHYSLLAALRQNNIPADQVTILDMNAQDIIAAWSRNEIDGAYVWQPAQSKLVADDGKVIISSAEVAKNGDITGEFGIVSNTFAEKYPNIVKDYIDILDEAAKQYKQQDPDTVKVLSSELGLSEDKTKEAMSQISVLDKAQQQEYIGTPDKVGSLPKILKSTSDFLLSQKSVSTSPDIDFFTKALCTELYK